MATIIFAFVHLFRSRFLSSSLYYNSANPNMTGDSHNLNREENDTPRPTLYANLFIFPFDWNEPQIHLPIGKCTGKAYPYSYPPKPVPAYPWVIMPWVRGSWVLACIGCRWPSLACVTEAASADVGCSWLSWTCAGLRWLM
jgi:hypothetical protein